MLFYIAATISVMSTTLVITRTNASHALIYLIVSLLSIAVIFYVLGAPFAAALEIVIYAGAIMVLFLFVIMLLNPAPLKERFASGPVLTGLTFALGVLFVAALMRGVMSLAGAGGAMAAVGEGYGSTRSVGELLFTAYLYPFELTGVLLLVAMVGAVVLARRQVAGED